MNPELEKRIARIASDRESGASELLASAVAVLRAASAAGRDLPAVAAALRDAQPSMAGIWNATEAALTGDLERFAAQAARAAPAIARFAIGLLETGLEPGAPLRVVTISFSSVVAHVISTMASRRPVHVACGEGRPALEGRRMAEGLLGAGASVICYADAALAHALRGSDAVLVGADAVGPEWLVNKSGTFMLAAAAAHHGVAVYAVAGREKFLTAEMAGLLRLRAGAPEEVWDAGPSGPKVDNTYFERVPLGLITAVITDSGIRHI